MALKENKKIVLISSGQPSLNPRLVKEADTLIDAGYAVTVIYQYWNQWGTALDNALLPQKKWKAIRIGGSPEQGSSAYWYSRLKHKFGRLAAFRFGIKGPFAEMALGRCTNLLATEAVRHPADLYIAHNLAALPAAVKAAKKHTVKCGFDAEDFHRNEVTDNPSDFDVRLKIYIENKYLPLVDYLSTSSPLISEAYRQLYKFLPVTILNTFPSANHVKHNIARDASKLKLFWFSQTISAERGVGECISALKQLNNPDIELHLLGYATDRVKQRLANLAGNIQLIFHDPIAPDEIVSFASQFDAGLAMEDVIPLNRDLCLTNKIFTYLQAGLAIIASDTSAQKQLLYKYTGIGQVYSRKIDGSLSKAISFYKDHRDVLADARGRSTQLATDELNWEQESKKLLSVVKNTLAG